LGASLPYPSVDQRDRFARLPGRALPGGVCVFEAHSSRARLRGLARMDEPPPGYALLITRCRSVHTFGMRFPLDLAFLDRDERPVEVVRDVPPRRILSHRAARSVLEIRAGQIDRLLAAWRAVAAPAPLAQPPAPTSRRSRNVRAESASSSVTFSSSD
jgi:uncharacterized protein